MDFLIKGHKTVLGLTNGRAVIWLWVLLCTGTFGLQTDPTEYKSLDTEWLGSAFQLCPTWKQTLRRDSMSSGERTRALGPLLLAPSLSRSFPAMGTQAVQ